jgi:diketogulonate reductase-like aldo/keto reductase
MSMAAPTKKNAIKRRFGPLPDEVPIVGQGTWMMGERRDRAREVEALRAGLDAGLTHIDTAEMYGNGLSEEMVAEAISETPRDRLFLVSKVLPNHASRKGTVAACEASLRRLRTDHLDAYLLHWRGSYPLEETFAGMDDLLRAGKIRAFGVSNFDVSDMEEAFDLLGGAPLACNQVLYNLGERYVDDQLLAICEERNVALVAYSPFGHGDFPDAASKGGRALAAVAEKHGATPRQVALAFLAREAPLFVIPKASSAAHARENAGALSLALSDADRAAIDAAFPVRPGGGLPML